jgi:cytochrome c nitrite reductase small subunit
MQVMRFITLGWIPRSWRLVCAATLGLAAGLGATTIYLSRAPSYLSDAPETCVNCHVMNASYLSWQHSSHARVATCNDCHVPHDSAVRKYAFKAQDGLRHSTMYALRKEPQVLRISAAAKPVVQENCLRCHSQLTDTVHLSDRLCWDCHREVPHGFARSLSVSSDLMAPALPGIGDNQAHQTIGGREARPAAAPTAKE